MKKHLSIVLCFFLAALLFILPSSQGFAQHNDAKYDNYKNMIQQNTTGHAKYIVPNLYKQDASYNNVKLFPLVVNNSVEYFPLDIFTQFSYLEIKYSELVYGFYINNKRNNQYVAVNLETGDSSTHDNANANIDVQIFNRTYYLPGKAVCDALGLNFETYDSPTDGIRAARVSDSSAKYTLNDLIKAYSPVKIDPDVITPEDWDPVVSPTDPYTSVANRNIYLTFENGLGSSYIHSTLDALKSKGVKAAFFADKTGILSYPDTVRRIIAEGHTFGIYINPYAQNGEALSNEQIIALADDANDALELVAKTSTRIVRTARGATSVLDTNGFAEAAGNAGYTLFGWSVDAADYSGNTSSAIYSSLLQKIIGNNPSARRSVYVTFGAYRVTPYVVTALLDFCSRYKQFRVIAYDEYTQVPAFPAW